MTVLQATLLLSVFMHAVGLFGWSLCPPQTVMERESDARLWVVDLVAYREHGPAALPQGPRDAVASLPPSGRRVSYAEGYLGHVAPPPRRDDMRGPKQQPTRRAEMMVRDVPAPPPPVRAGIEVSSSTPAAVASSDPPPEASAETPVGGVSDPPEDAPESPDVAPRQTSESAPAAPSAGGGTPVAASSTPSFDETSRSPEAPAASPSSAPSSATLPAPALALDPQADFALVLGYHNDDRIRRDARGALELDVAAISTLSDVKPVLALNAPAVLPLSDASRCGLHPMDRARATVRVDVVLDVPLPQLVAPRNIEVAALDVDGRTLLAEQRDALSSFIRQGVEGTRWFPGSNLGVWSERSEQVFEVEVLQASDTAMSPPTSRAP